MTTTWAKQSKNTDTFANQQKDFPGTYGGARYGISTYGTAIIDAGVFSNQNKNTSTFTNETKS